MELTLFCVLLLFCVSAEDPPMMHYRERNSSLCLKVREPPPHKDIKWRFNDKVIVMQKTVSPNYLGKVNYNPQDHSVCINNLNKTDNGSYQVTVTDAEYYESVEKHVLIVEDSNIILVSPVHPVTEGDSVTLGCKFRTEQVPYNVDFYKNDKLIQSVTGGELTISAVSKSDEGFYKCKGKDSPQGLQTWTSPESWMSVKSSRPEQSSPFPVLLIVGLVGGVSLILFLLLFVCRYTKSKDSCFMRSQSTNQGPAPDHNQDEMQGREYASLLHGDVCLYETIRGSEEPEHGRNNEPEEHEYSNVTTGSAAVCSR